MGFFRRKWKTEKEVQDEIEPFYPEKKYYIKDLGGLFVPVACQKTIVWCSSDGTYLPFGFYLDGIYYHCNIDGTMPKSGLENPQRISSGEFCSAFKKAIQKVEKEESSIITHRLQ